ncbi:MAG: TraX family protein [Candidatus Bathyarchaeota archaeon]
MNLNQQGFDLGRDILKWIAIITMTIDHIGAVLYPQLEILRIIGRISFPLFAYLLILGMESTRNIRSYFTRLLAIGVGPFDSLNIFFTLSFGLVFVYFFKKNSWIAFIPIFLSFILSFDYNIYGMAIIGCMYILNKNIKFGAGLLILLNTIFLLPWSNQFLSLMSLPFIILHNNGTLDLTKYTDNEFRMPIWRKYFFYIYYPLHLSVLYFISQYYF